MHNVSYRIAYGERDTLMRTQWELTKKVDCSQSFDQSTSHALQSHQAQDRSAIQRKLTPPHDTDDQSAHLTTDCLPRSVGVCETTRSIDYQ